MNRPIRFIITAMAVVGLLSGGRPLANSALIAGRLFRRRGLFDRRSFDIALFALLISFVQELVDYARASLLLDPNLLRLLLVSEELVIYFPAHCLLHPRRTNGITTPQYRSQLQSPR